MTLTVQRLREVLDYDPATGIFRWKIFMGSRALPGQQTGCPDHHGYLLIRVDKVVYKAHRLAWLWMTGQWPTKDVDHKNGRGSDNRWDNLREATMSQNLGNSKIRRHNKSGRKGVSWSKAAKKWHAQIIVNRKNHHLGYYDDIDQAALAYAEAANRFHGEYARLK